MAACLTRDRVKLACAHTSQARGALEKEQLESARDLLAWCLQPDPSERPQTMMQASALPARSVWQTAQFSQPPIHQHCPPAHEDLTHVNIWATITQVLNSQLATGNL